MNLGKLLKSAGRTLGPIAKEVILTALVAAATKKLTKRPES